MRSLAILRFRLAAALSFRPQRLPASRIVPHASCVHPIATTDTVKAHSRAFARQFPLKRLTRIPGWPPTGQRVVVPVPAVGREEESFSPGASRFSFRVVQTLRIRLARSSRRTGMESMGTMRPSCVPKCR
jgi:hypothetical protein